MSVEKLKEVSEKAGAEAPTVNHLVGAFADAPQFTLLTVFLQLLPILENSIPQVYQVVSDIITAIKAPNFQWSSLASLGSLGTVVQKDWALLVGVVKTIASALGVTLPAAPTAAPKPA